MQPDLSVVIVTLEGPRRLERCLEALSRQSPMPQLEILVPWDATRPDPAALAAKFPTARFMPVTGRRTYAELRSIGVAAAQAPIVAITEDHCMPCPDWCHQILENHKSKHAAVGGAVEKDTPDTALNWSFYFADYLRYLAPAEGPSFHLTDCNVTYKLASLQPIASIWRNEFHENQVHEALAARGESLWISPKVLVRQKRHLELGPALWDRYAFGRLFAATRLVGAPTVRRLIFLATSFLLPALLLLRIVGHLKRTGRYYSDFVKASPLVILVCSTWALGEFIGYLTGKPEEKLSAAPSKSAA
jgi:hypothetical protein